jgi:hypothetical protein
MSQRGNVKIKAWWKSQTASLKAAYVAGLFAVLGGFINGISGPLASFITTDSGAVRPTPHGSQTIAPSPGPLPTSRSSPPGAEDSTSPDPFQHSPIVSLMIPVNQFGWTFKWRQSVKIGPAGVILAPGGALAGDGTNFDLQYISDFGTDWRKKKRASAFAYWNDQYQPGPAVINGMVHSGADHGLDPTGVPASVGDRLFYENVARDVVAYIQVVNVTPEDVKVLAWLWEKN